MKNRKLITILIPMACIILTPFYYGIFGYIGIIYFGIIGGILELMFTLGKDNILDSEI